MSLKLWSGMVHGLIASTDVCSSDHAAPMDALIADILSLFLFERRSLLHGRFKPEGMIKVC